MRAHNVMHDYQYSQRLVISSDSIYVYRWGARDGVLHASQCHKRQSTCREQSAVSGDTRGSVEIARGEAPSRRYQVSVQRYTDAQRVASIPIPGSCPQAVTVISQ